MPLFVLVVGTPAQISTASVSDAVKQLVLGSANVDVLATTDPGDYVWDGTFHVKPGEFDPGKTYLVQGAWLSGIGCPTMAKTVLPNEMFTDVGEPGPPFTDPACPTGDQKDNHVEGLLLAKTGPTVTNFASAVARIDGVKGQVLTELGWDIRKAGPDSFSPLGSHCGAGAPR